MFDLVKPNREWKQVAKDFNGTFKSGGLLSATEMQISKNGLTFNIRTSYSNDNFWSGRTVIFCTFHYQQECSIEIRKNILTSMIGKSQGVLKISRGQGDLRQKLIDMPKLNVFRNKWNIFNLTFKTDGIIAENYEVLPKIELKLKGFVIKKKEFDAIFEIIDEMAKELIQRKIISSAPNNKYT